MRRYLFILAAMLACFAPQAEALVTPLPDLSESITAPAPAVAPDLIIEAVYPIGYAEDGDCLDIVVCVEAETHTRVVYIVKSPLGLWYMDQDDAVAEPGDTLSELAEILTGNGANWETLGYAGDPNRMPVGTRIPVGKWVEPLRNKIRNYAGLQTRLRHYYTVAGVTPQGPLYCDPTILGEVSEASTPLSWIAEGGGMYARASQILYVPKVPGLGLLGKAAPVLSIGGETLTVYTLAKEGDIEGAQRHVAYGLGMITGVAVGGPPGWVIGAGFGVSTLADSAASRRWKERIRQGEIAVFEGHTATLRLARKYATKTRRALGTSAAGADQAMKTLQKLEERPFVIFGESGSRLLLEQRNYIIETQIGPYDEWNTP